MIRMTFLSMIGHIVALAVLLFLAWYQPMPPKLKMPQRPRIDVRMLTPLVVTPKPTAKPPEKTRVIARKTKTPTPTPTKTPRKTKTPTPRPTKTPKATKSPTPKATKSPTPKATPEPTRTPRPTPKPEPTPKVTPRAADPKLLPAPGKEVAIQPSPLSDYEYWLLNSQAKIEQNFSIPRHLQNPNLTCTVHFTVLQDGTIQNVLVTSGTGDEFLDGYAVRAMQMTRQLPPLPDTLKLDSIELDVTFVYETR